MWIMSYYFLICTISTCMIYIIQNQIILISSFHACVDVIIVDVIIDTEIEYIDVIEKFFQLIYLVLHDLTRFNGNQDNNQFLSHYDQP